jgi:hypothetical protein
MKKILFLLVLALICAMPANAGTVRNGVVTIYHNSQYGLYPNRHVNTDNLNENKKPVYTYSAIGTRPKAYGKTCSRPVSARDARRTAVVR